MSLLVTKSDLAHLCDSVNPDDKVVGSLCGGVFDEAMPEYMGIFNKHIDLILEGGEFSSSEIAQIIALRDVFQDLHPIIKVRYLSLASAIGMGSHAVCIFKMKTGDGLWIAGIANSGYGIDHHIRRRHERSYVYLPFLSIVCDTEKIRDALFDMLAEIPDRSVQGLYNTGKLWLLCNRHSRLFIPADLCDWHFMTGQKRGTCFFRWMIAFSRTILCHEHSFSRVSYKRHRVYMKCANLMIISDRLSACPLVPMEDVASLMRVCDECARHAKKVMIMEGDSMSKIGSRLMDLVSSVRMQLMTKGQSLFLSAAVWKDLPSSSELVGEMFVGRFAGMCNAMQKAVSRSGLNSHSDWSSKLDATYEHVVRRCGDLFGADGTINVDETIKYVKWLNEDLMSYHSTECKEIEGVWQRSLFNIYSVGCIVTKMTSYMSTVSTKDRAIDYLKVISYLVYHVHERTHIVKLVEKISFQTAYNACVRDIFSNVCHLFKHCTYIIGVSEVEMSDWDAKVSVMLEVMMPRAESGDAKHFTTPVYANDPFCAAYSVPFSSAFPSSAMPLEHSSYAKIVEGSMRSFLSAMNDPKMKWDVSSLCGDRIAKDLRYFFCQCFSTGNDGYIMAHLRVMQCMLIWIPCSLICEESFLNYFLRRVSHQYCSFKDLNRVELPPTRFRTAIIYGDDILVSLISYLGNAANRSKLPDTIMHVFVYACEHFASLFDNDASPKSCWYNLFNGLCLSYCKDADCPLSDSGEKSFLEMIESLKRACWRAVVLQRSTHMVVSYLNALKYLLPHFILLSPLSMRSLAQFMLWIYSEESRMGLQNFMLEARVDQGELILEDESEDELHRTNPRLLAISLDIMMSLRTLCDPVVSHLCVKILSVLRSADVCDEEIELQTAQKLFWTGWGFLECESLSGGVEHVNMRFMMPESKLLQLAIPWNYIKTVYQLFQYTDSESHTGKTTPVSDVELLLARETSLATRDDAFRVNADCTNEATSSVSIKRYADRWLLRNTNVVGTGWFSSLLPQSIMIVFSRSGTVSVCVDTLEMSCTASVEGRPFLRKTFDKTTHSCILTFENPLDGKSWYLKRADHSHPAYIVLSHLIPPSCFHFASEDPSAPGCTHVIVSLSRIEIYPVDRIENVYATASRSVTDMNDAERECIFWCANATMCYPFGNAVLCAGDDTKVLHLLTQKSMTLPVSFSVSASPGQLFHPVCTFVSLNNVPGCAAMRFSKMQNASKLIKLCNTSYSSTMVTQCTRIPDLSENPYTLFSRRRKTYLPKSSYEEAHFDDSRFVFDDQKIHIKTFEKLMGMEPGKRPSFEECLGVVKMNSNGAYVLAYLLPNYISRPDAFRGMKNIFQVIHEQMKTVALSGYHTLSEHYMYSIKSTLLASMPSAIMKVRYEVAHSVPLDEPLYEFATLDFGKQVVDVKEPVQGVPECDGSIFDGKRYVIDESVLFSRTRSLIFEPFDSFLEGALLASNVDEGDTYRQCVFLPRDHFLRILREVVIPSVNLHRREMLYFLFCSRARDLFQTTNGILSSATETIRMSQLEHLDSLIRDDEHRVAKQLLTGSGKTSVLLPLLASFYSSRASRIDMTTTPPLMEDLIHTMKLRNQGSFGLVTNDSASRMPDVSIAPMSVFQKKYMDYPRYHMVDVLIVDEIDEVTHPLKGDLNVTQATSRMSPLCVAKRYEVCEKIWRHCITHSMELFEQHPYPRLVNKDKLDLRPLMQSELGSTSDSEPLKSIIKNIFEKVASTCMCMKMNVEFGLKPLNLPVSKTPKTLMKEIETNMNAFVRESLGPHLPSWLNDINVPDHGGEISEDSVLYAVPYAAKDKPSPSSLFSDVDVTIMLTIMSVDCMRAVPLGHIKHMINSYVSDVINVSSPSHSLNESVEVIKTLFSFPSLEVMRVSSFATELFKRWVCTRTMYVNSFVNRLTPHTTVGWRSPYSKVIGLTGTMKYDYLPGSRTTEEGMMNSLRGHEGYFFVQKPSLDDSAMLVENTMVYENDTMLIHTKNEMEISQRLLDLRRRGLHPNALIDCGSFLCATPNLDVVQCVKSIVFGDDKDWTAGFISPQDGMVCTVEFRDNNRLVMPNHRLPKDEDYDFFFFDASSTTGFDVPNIRAGHGIVTVDTRNTERDVVQGVGRIRRALASKGTYQLSICHVLPNVGVTISSGKTWMDYVRHIHEVPLDRDMKQRVLMNGLLHECRYALRTHADTMGHGGSHEGWPHGDWSEWPRPKDFVMLKKNHWLWPNTSLYPCSDHRRSIPHTNLFIFTMCKYLGRAIPSDWVSYVATTVSSGLEGEGGSIHTFQTFGTKISTTKKTNVAVSQTTVESVLPSKDYASTVVMRFYKLVGGKILTLRQNHGQQMEDESRGILTTHFDNVRISIPHLAHREPVKDKAEELEDQALYMSHFKVDSDGTIALVTDDNPSLNARHLVPDRNLRAACAFLSKSFISKRDYLSLSEIRAVDGGESRECIPEEYFSRMIHDPLFFMASIGELHECAKACYEMLVKGIAFNNPGDSMLTEDMIDEYRLRMRCEGSEVLALNEFDISEVDVSADKAHKRKRGRDVGPDRNDDAEEGKVEIEGQQLSAIFKRCSIPLSMHVINAWHSALQYAGVDKSLLVKTSQGLSFITVCLCGHRSNFRDVATRLSFDLYKMYRDHIEGDAASRR